MIFCGVDISFCYEKMVILKTNKQTKLQNKNIIIVCIRFLTGNVLLQNDPYTLKNRSLFWGNVFFFRALKENKAHESYSYNLCLFVKDAIRVAPNICIHKPAYSSWKESFKKFEFLIRKPYFLWLMVLWHHILYISFLSSILKWQTFCIWKEV